MLDEEYMKIAIKQSKIGSFPFGAVIVKDGEIIAKASSGEFENDPTAHSETTAIRKACSKLNTTDLHGATIYCTCEPCLMCFGTLWWSNIRKIVYGVTIMDSVADGICTFMDGLNISVKQLNLMSSNDFEIIGGVCEIEVMEVMRKWKEVTNN
ncbi:MAG: nucleoside deaminase [Clostridia bacterium]|nr:nucleoside deaminase [Clostridia bacterium]MDD4387470.1 nucleoside deaminase [Clostridia bacterium]